MPILSKLESLLQSNVAKSLLTISSGDSDEAGRQLVVTAETIIKDSSLLPREVSKWCRRDVKGVAKDFNEAKAFKDLGASYFHQKGFLQAAEAYSQALQHVPQNNAEEQAFASKLYSNRSLCLIKTQGGAAEAEEDAHQAQLLDPCNWKAVHHRLLALIALQRVAAAVTFADDALCRQEMPKEEMQSIQRLRSQAEAAAENLGSLSLQEQECKSIARGDNESFNESSEACPPENAELNTPELKLASMDLENRQKDDQTEDTKVVLKTTEEEGQHLVARADILPHDTVFSEEASLAVVTKSHKKQCSAAIYCSPACQASHRAHCKIPQVCGSPWSLLIPEEGLLAVAMALDNQEDKCLQLETHLADHDPADLISALALACLLKAFWEESSQSSQSSSGLLSSHEVFLALLKIQINGIAIVPKEHASAEDRLAIAIFPRASKLNHACKPNVDFQFVGRKLVVIAREAILQGQVVRHCYGPQVGGMTTQQRQHALQRQYKFGCQCQWCLFPREFEEGMTALKCPSCHGPVKPQSRQQPGICSLHEFPGSSATCSRCKTHLSMKEERDIVQRLEEANQKYQLAHQSLRDTKWGTKSADILKAVKLLMDCLRVQEALLYENNQRLGQTYDAAGNALSQTGDSEGAQQYLRRAAEIVRLHFGEDSVAYNHQWHKLELAGSDAAGQLPQDGKARNLD